MASFDRLTRRRSCDPIDHHAIEIEFASDDLLGFLWNSKLVDLVDSKSAHLTTPEFRRSIAWCRSSVAMVPGNVGHS
jgi:hypothetical protein